MSPPSWLPPLNSHDHYITVVSLQEFDKLPQDDEWFIPEQAFVIHIDVSVEFISYANSKAIQGLVLHKELCIPCYEITDVPYSEAVEFISFFISGMRIPFTLDHIYLQQNYLESDVPESSWEADDEKLIDKFHSFLDCMKGKVYNSNRHRLPLKLEIRKVVQISDQEYCAWTSWYDEKKRVDPSFAKDYRQAIRRTRTDEELADEASVKARGATNLSLEALEDVMVLDDSISTPDCVICFGKLQAEKKLIRLPCSHIFHGDCIMRWLEETNMCPLCRSVLPPQSRV